MTSLPILIGTLEPAWHGAMAAAVVAAWLLAARRVVRDFRREATPAGTRAR